MLDVLWHSAGKRKTQLKSAQNFLVKRFQVVFSVLKKKKGIVAAELHLFKHNTSFY